MTTNLAKKLRQGTIRSLSMAGNVSFVKSFLSSVVDEINYRILVANLYFLCTPIENEMLKNKEHKSINSIHLPELNRRKSLE